MTATDRERLDALSETLRRDGGVKVEHTGISVLELTIDKRVKVACHPQPWDGPLYFCVPSSGGGSCRILGRAEQVSEVAGVVLRLVRSGAASPEAGRDRLPSSRPCESATVTSGGRTPGR